MKFALDTVSAKQMDEYTREKIGIPSLVLMERAALCVAENIMYQYPKNVHILCVCGAGGNGGDGIAVARILFQKGYATSILFLSKEEKAVEETKRQLLIARHLNIPFVIETELCFSSYDIIVDAIFGIGLNRKIEGKIANVINQINEASICNHKMKVIAVDIASGIDASNGECLGTAIKADETITFGYAKIGQMLHTGRMMSGKVSVVDIGFSEEALKKLKINTFYYEDEDRKQLPLRNQNGNKGTFGKVIVIAGRRNISGAAFLSAKACYRTGAGMVMVASEEENRVILQTLLPEMLFTPIDFRGMVFENALAEKIENWSTGIVIGPGIGTDEKARELCLKTFALLRKTNQFAIIDADALHIIGDVLREHRLFGLSEKLQFLTEILPEQCVLTPHLKELSYLLNIRMEEMKENLLDIAQDLSKGKITFVIKDARTLVAGNNQVYINTSGNEGMATAGSGDVLTGIISALVAQKMPYFNASCLGVYLHGLAGDKAKDSIGSYALMASNIIEYLPEVLF